MKTYNLYHTSRGVILRNLDLADAVALAELMNGEYEPTYFVSMGIELAA